MFIFCVPFTAAPNGEKPQTLFKNRIQEKDTLHTVKSQPFPLAVYRASKQAAPQKAPQQNWQHRNNKRQDGFVLQVYEFGFHMEALRLKCSAGCQAMTRRTKRKRTRRRRKRRPSLSSPPARSVSPPKQFRGGR